MRQINLLKGRDVVRELLEGVGRMARDGMLPATSRKEFRARGDLTTQSVMTLGKVQELSRSGAVVMDNGPVVECLSKCASDAEAGRMGAPGTRSVAQQGGVTLRYEVGSASGCAGDHRH